MKRNFVTSIIILSVTLYFISACNRPAAQSTNPSPTLLPQAGTEPTKGTPVTPQVMVTNTPTIQPTSAGTLTIMHTATTPPTFTPSPEPTKKPTSTPEPSATPEPTDTLEPTATLAPTATVEPTTTPEPTATPEPEPEYTITHTVQAGENLYRIGLLYGISWEDIARVNGITDPNSVYTGLVLVIPVEEPLPTPVEGQTHVVQAGENLYRISLMYGISMQEIADANGITDPDEIYVGMTLKIPGAN